MIFEDLVVSKTFVALIDFYSFRPVAIRTRLM